MKLVIARPDSQKVDLYDATVELLSASCTTNGVPMPRLIRRRLGGSRCGMTCMGHDGTSAVIIDVRGCDDPSEGRFPAAPVDSTVAGVLAHEFGHAVLNWLERDGDRWARRIMAIAGEEAPVSDYGQESAHEQFAEAFRLAVLNPDLLRVGRPRRWELLHSFGLTFPEPMPWRSVIGAAGQWVVQMTERWIHDGTA